MARSVFVLATVVLRLSGTAAAEDSTTNMQIAAEGGTEEERAEPGTETTEGAIETTGSGRARLSEVVVEAAKPFSAASSQEIRAQDFASRPHATIQEVLNNIPGLVVTQHQGGGKATQYLIRGFDSDHGTDVSVWVDGLPVNMVSHAHGQGYADLGFVIPETINAVQLFKGPYFVEYGDFATAAALDFDLVDKFAEDFVHTEFGMFDTMRLVGGVSPEIGEVQTVAAAQAYFSNGPFIDPQHFQRFNGFLKGTFEPAPDSKLSIWASAMSSDWDASGQIPLRLVETGELSPFGSLDNSEGGSTDREDLVFDYTWEPTDVDTVKAIAYVTHYSLDLFSDFTFFKDSGLRFVQNPDGTVTDTGGAEIFPGANYIPGDGIRQTDDRVMFGGQVSYTRDWDVATIPSQTRIGMQNRNDNIGVTLRRQVRRTVFFDVNDGRIHESSLGLYLGHQMFPTDWLRFEVGLRGDIFWFDVGNRLGPQGQDPNFFSVSVAGKNEDSIVSPKANIVVMPVENTEVYLNFGTGFHSNDARAVVPNTINSPDPETFVPASVAGFSPLTRAVGYEVGTRTRQFDSLDLASALWLIDLDSELTFCGDCGTLEGTGGTTRRWGLDFEARYQATDWLFVDYDLTWDDPRIIATGEAIPLAPTLLMNGGARVRPFLGIPGLEGFEAAVRVRYLDNYPANETRTITAKGYTLVDLVGRYRWRNVELGIDFLNITDTLWREAQFAFGSCTLGDENGMVAVCNPQPGHEPQDGIDDINFTPGIPFGVRAGITVFF